MLIDLPPNTRQLPTGNEYLVHLQKKEQLLPCKKLFKGKQAPKTKAIITARLNMLSLGHFGDHKRFEGLIELRWKNGTRVYSFMWGHTIVVALKGGNKNGQDRDIKKAKKIRDEVLEGTRTIQE